MMNQKDLTSKKCQPCQKGTPPLSSKEIQERMTSVSGWQLGHDSKSIFHEYITVNFMSAVRLIDKIADLAESEDHHPDLHLTGYRKLKVELATHSIGGLSENDFILAAKIDQLPKELKK